MTGVFESSSYTFSWFAVPVLAVGLLNWLLGLATLYRERASPPSLTLLAMTLVIGVWLLGLGAAYSSTDHEVALAWVKVSMVGTVFVPVSAFMNAAMGSSKLRLMRLFTLAGCVFSALLAVLVIRTDLVLDHAQRYAWGYYPIYGRLGPVLITYYAAFFVGGGILYRIGQRATKSVIHQRRMKVRLAALLIAAPATIDFLATMHVAVYPCGYAFIMGYIALSTYNVWRHRLVDITPALAARQIIDTMAEGLLVFDRDGIVRVANDAAEATVGSGRSVVGATCADVDRHWIGGTLAPLLDPEQQSRGELTFQRAGDEPGSVAVSTSKLLDARGVWVGTVCIMHDITERQLSEAAVRASEALYRALVETSSDGVIVTDESGQVIMTNARALELIGRREDTGAERSALEFIAEQDRERLQTSIRSATGAMVTRNDEYTLVKADGTLVPVELSISLISDTRDALRIMAVVRDISERKRNEEEIRYLAFHDSLTGAATRAVLLDRLAGCLSRAKRSGAPVGLIFVDLDGFKQVNDTQGHDAGDATLRQVSAILQSNLRDGDTLARVGGDEFVLLLPDLAHANVMDGIAERVLTELRRAVREGRLARVTASLGLASYPEDAAEPGELMQHADSAMYRAKSRGGDSFEVWTSERQAAA
jgi:diguanylate cyclase (GGDEF)-like protein/PAS domain S-box-containing protein